jgi:hypothetical protein
MNDAVGSPVLDAPARRALMMRVPVAVLLAVAIFAALIGVGGLLADPARVWPWVTVVVAGALGAVGVFWMRKLVVHLTLRVAKPFSPARFAGMWAAITVLFAVVIVVGWVLELKVASLLVVGLAIPVVRYRSSSALIVGWDGMRLDRTLFPFASVSRLLLAAGQDDQVIVAVDLRAGAALPNDMTEDRPSMAIDRKRLDIQQLTATIHRFSRGATEVVVG